MFSSNFPRIPDPNALRCEGHPDAESLRTSTSRPAELRKPQWTPTGLGSYQRLNLYATAYSIIYLSLVGFARSQGRQMGAILGVKGKVVHQY